MILSVQVLFLKKHDPPWVVNPVHSLDRVHQSSQTSIDPPEGSLTSSRSFPIKQSVLDLLWYSNFTENRN